MKPITKNMSLSILSRIVTMLTGIVIQNRILVAFGSDLNGLTSSITQIMSYLVLLEAGIGMASIQALYTPLAKDDWEEISGVLSATGREYKKISTTFLILLIAVSIAFPLLVSGQVDYALAAILTFLTGASYVLSYIIGGKYKALLSADQRIYVLYLLDIIVAILSCVTRLIALHFDCNIIYIQLINLICVLVKNIGYYIYVKYKYRYVNYQAAPLMHCISKRWSVLIHNIAGIIVNQTDVMLLTVFATLKDVSVYSVYYMVFGQLSTFIQSTFVQAAMATFGKVYNSKGNYIKFYEKYEMIFTIMLFVISTCALCLSLPFIRLYTVKVSDINYIDGMLPILFMLTLIMNQVRAPSAIMINVAGHFKETQKGAIIESILNLCISIFLVLGTSLGMYGLLIGTICSYCYRTVDIIVYNYKHILEMSINNFLKLIMLNIGTMLLIITVFYWICPITASGFFIWIIKAVIFFVFVTIAFILVNSLVFREFYLEIIKIKNKFVNNFVH